ncbi:MAG: DUF456 domain-containing protein [Cyclobacteriaceae bacterium]|nr:DUF456 domain-containing protein [Cyclobacteriaceae bacterium]
MDLVWAVIGGILMLAGIIGCLLPLIPGPPLSFSGLLLLQLRETAPFTSKFLMIWAVIVITITVMDYLVPIYGTKRFGGTKYGLWGCTIGLIAGFWFGPIGIIAGPFLGALLGEWLGNRNSDQALKAAIGSFVGFLVGTVIKLIASGVMTYYFIVSFI